jgi:dihydroorotate dehydrogenase
VSAYVSCLRPLLFRLDPETVHNFASTLLRLRVTGLLLGQRRTAVRDGRLHVALGGRSLENPVGLAPGFDKDCEMLPTLTRLGFGYVVAGSVCPKARQGSPKPRIVRYPDQDAIVSSMGLPSKGLDYAARRLATERRSAPVFVNVSGFTPDDYVSSATRLFPVSDGIELSLSCSNCSEAGGDLLDVQEARGLFGRVAPRKEGKPLFIKIPAYGSEEERRNRLELIEAAADLGVDGVTLTTGWTVEEKLLATRSGALSGHPLLDRTLEVVRDVYAATGGRCAIKARGGIFSGEDAFNAIAAGATTVEMYSAFIYRGWHAASQINRSLLALLDAHSIPDVESLRGCSIRSTLISAGIDR